MIDLIILFFLGIVLFNIFNVYCLRRKLLIDGLIKSEHKSYVNKIDVPITGGILIIFTIIFLLKDISIVNKFFFIIIFSLGLLSDINKISSPKVRLFFQSFIVIIYIYFNDTYISTLRIDYIDQYLLNQFIFKIIFSTFCILILINGSNFIDGVNTLNSGYYLIIFLNILFISNHYEIEAEIYNLKILVTILLIFILHNFFNKSFLGDGGSYLISFYAAIFFIHFSNQNNLVSPYYIAVMLWYPAFENFFSLTRRLFFEKKKIKNADNLHLHHLLYIFIRKKIIDNKIANTLTGLSINFYNLIIIIIANNFLYETIPLLLILILSMIFYISVYFLLKRNIK